MLSIFCFAPSIPALASMASPSYRIDWDTLSNGGLDNSGSASYLLRDTIGGTSMGVSESDNYQLRAGYRGGVNDLLLSFSLYPESTGTSSTASALAGTTVTLASVAGFSVGDYAAVIENVGLNQVSAFGRITAKAPGTLTFDDLADNGTAPVIDGIGDRVYLLNGNTIALGELASGEASTALIAFEVTAVSDNGYSVQMFDDGDLRTGLETISDVADGAVTITSEEYGAISSDTTLATSTFDTQDSAITTSPQAVSTESIPAFNNRHFVTIKATVAPDTTDGSYGQTLSLVATGNY